MIIVHGMILCAMELLTIIDSGMVYLHLHEQCWLSAVSWQSIRGRIQGYNIPHHHNQHQLAPQLLFSHLTRQQREHGAENEGS